MRKSSGENEKFWRNWSKLKDWEVAQRLFYLLQIFLTGIDLSHLLATATIIKHSVDNRRMLLNACVPPLPHLTSDLLQRLTFITCESISARFHESRFCNPDCTHATPPSHSLLQCVVPRPGREVAIVAIVSHTTPSSRDLTDTVSWKPAGHQEDKKGFTTRGNVRRER